MMKKLLITLGLILMVPSMAYAKTPPEVLKPYKEYRAALDASDKNKAFKAAQKAWMKAEELLGDHKTTGDLASNFAVLEPESKNYSIKDYDIKMKAHKRSIALSKFYEDGAEDIELERHLKRIETALSLFNTKDGKKKASSNQTYFKDMEAALDAYDRRGSVFEADMEVLRLRFYDLGNNPKKGLEAAKRAERIYAAGAEGYVSHYPILLKLFKGNVLKADEQHINAALEYQEVMQNLEGKLPADHHFVKTAFTQWVIVRSELEEAGRLADAQDAGLCQCWPYGTPPIMPQHAKRSGHAIIVLDVDEAGKPFNVRVLSSSEKIFEAPAIKAVKKWVYSPIGRGEDAKVRTDVSTKISFKLTSESGEILPEK